MGDMADWVLENEIVDYLESGTPDNANRTICRYCGQEDLIWSNLGSKKKPKWRLFEKDGVIHQCARYQKQGE